MARRKGGVGGIPPRPSFRIHHLDLFRKKFELRPKTTANWENANLKRSARGARRAARIEFERAFLAKRKRIYQSKYGSSRFVLEMLSFPSYPQRKVISPLGSRI